MTDRVIIPANEIPSFRIHKAIEKKSQNDWLLWIQGGLGDKVTAEPTVRFILNQIPEAECSLLCETPEIFSHLDFKSVFTDESQVDLSKHYVVRNLWNYQSLLSEFLSHVSTHCVDHASIAMLRMQLPTADREIRLPDFSHADSAINEVIQSPNDWIVIHAGKHWPSKTVPGEWWGAVIDELRGDFKVCLIGKQVDENVGYVDLCRSDCLDLTNALVITELVQLLKGCRYLLTTDSAPIHIAAAGNAFIGFIASPKRPDFLYHWRHGTWAWFMKAFNRDGLYNYLPASPIQENDVRVDKMNHELWKKILPDPKSVADHYRKIRRPASERIGRRTITEITGGLTNQNPSTQSGSGLRRL